MELRALRYFVAVAEELHFGRAAERLHIVQPAVSQQVARLERELGVRLLERSPRHVRLTAAGRRVLDAAREALAAADRVRAVVRRPAGTIRIGTAAGLTGRLERGVDALRTHDPALDVVLVDLPICERLGALRRGELDLALVRGAVPGPGLRVQPAWTEPLHAVVSHRHPTADRHEIAVADLAGSILRLPGDPVLRDAVTAALAAAGVQPALGRATGTTQDTVVEVGADPTSWALLPAEQIAGAASSRVRSIPLHPPLAVTGHVVTAEDGTPDACVENAVAAFRDPVGE